MSAQEGDIRATPKKVSKQGSEASQIKRKRGWRGKPGILRRGLKRIVK